MLYGTKSKRDLDKHAEMLFKHNDNIKATQNKNKKLKLDRLKKS